jgi:hypothetical protein
MCLLMFQKLYALMAARKRQKIYVYACTVLDWRSGRVRKRKSESPNQILGYGYPYISRKDSYF